MQCIYLIRGYEYDMEKGNGESKHSSNIYRSLEEKRAKEDCGGKSVERYLTDPQTNAPARLTQYVPSVS